MRADFLGFLHFQNRPRNQGLSKQQNLDSRGSPDLAREFFYVGMMYAAFRTA
jgi:hypothetical protein